ncbi:YciI family protein [Granulicella sp. L46]|uniref:YciI family protein n=1 Tax=Granulicella sp. L46 TaxID=1641865 RepID=UPI0020B143B6|nr:YciI family protein [Granulicella sp. L46]
MKRLSTDGPYLEAKEHIGGFWILEAADMDEALAWARKAAFDPSSRGEVREIPYSSLPTGTPHPSRVKPKP